MLLELLVSAVVLSLVCAGAFWVFTRMNAYASTHRFLTAAQSVAQSQVDLLLSTPYTLSNVPPELAVTPSPPPAMLVPLLAGNTPVNGTMTTEVVLAEPALGVRRFTVTVGGAIGGRAHNVVMTGMRAPD
jgi:hypothetical protein